MIAQIIIGDNNYTVDLSQPIDISIPMKAGEGQVRAWYLGPVRVEPVKGDDFIGDVKQGGSVNFRDIYFNPHGHCTHTECVGHISHENHSVNISFSQFFFKAKLISISPEVVGEDQIIQLKQVKAALSGEMSQAIVIRTLPNSADKKTINYSNTNPPYLAAEAAKWLREIGVLHLLIDLPSVDREVDGGALAAHKAWWNYPEQPRLEATITELIYVDSSIPDGNYLLNIQMASFENDASPSRPVLYKLQA